MKKVFILPFNFILNLKVKNADSFKYVDFKFVIFKREVDLKLNSDGISLKRVMIKL